MYHKLSALSWALKCGTSYFSQDFIPFLLVLEKQILWFCSPLTRSPECVSGANAVNTILAFKAMKEMSLKKPKSVPWPTFEKVFIKLLACCCLPGKRIPYQPYSFISWEPTFLVSPRTSCKVHSQEYISREEIYCPCVEGVSLAKEREVRLIWHELSGSTFQDFTLPTFLLNCLGLWSFVYRNQSCVSSCFSSLWIKFSFWQQPLKCHTTCHVQIFPSSLPCVVPPPAPALFSP